MQGRMLNIRKIKECIFTDLRLLKGKRVFVGLSGGVDSAVSAALLQQAGALVTGVFIKGWYPPGMPCTWAEERRDAMRVAAHLHIPFKTFDASRTYKEEVIDYLLREYRAGRTPNPDVMCNKEVKFGVFYTFAKTFGADAIATGHYRSGEKDQSYFLWAVPHKVLAETVFPVGKLDKNTVRLLANEYHLPVARKKESQGICFLGSVSVEEFLRESFGNAPGSAYDEALNYVGEHTGVLLHTIGERVGLLHAQPGPWYVLSKNIKENKLIVGKQRFILGKDSAREIAFAHANWHTDSLKVTHAQYRYRGEPIAGLVTENRFISEKELSEVPVAGQSIVFYQGDQMIGGGIIEA